MYDIGSIAQMVAKITCVGQSRRTRFTIVLVTFFLKG